MESFIRIVEIIGTIAFAISGAATGIRKGMDIFGVSILGVVTAVGGGIIRDLMIGVTPPQCFQNSLYMNVACISAVIFFMPFIRIPLQKRQKAFDWVLFLMDNVGLAVFTVVGIQTAQSVSDDFGLILLVCVGVLTGTGGGVLRDLLARDMPYIFRKHIYATASLAGAVVYLLLEKWVGVYVATGVAMVVIIIIRFLSATFHWNLPHAQSEET